MTRRSKRELESALDDLTGDATAVESWVREQLAAGYEYDPTADGVDPSSNVCILETQDAKAYASLKDAPESIDPEKDLPVIDP